MMNTKTFLLLCILCLATPACGITSLHGSGEIDLEVDEPEKELEEKKE